MESWIRVQGLGFKVELWQPQQELPLEIFSFSERGSSCAAGGAAAAAAASLPYGGPGSAALAVAAPRWLGAAQ